MEEGLNPKLGALMEFDHHHIILHPHEQQQSEDDNKGATFTRTCFNGLNTLSGTGILVLPYALAQTGWLGLILLIVLSLLCWYTGLLIHRCLESDPSTKSYPDIGHLAFGSIGRAVVSLFLYLELYAAAVQFLILEGDNLAKLFPTALDRPFLGTKVTLNTKAAFTILSAMIILPTTWLRSLGGVMAYVSFGGAVSGVVLMVAVFWVGVQFEGFDDNQGKMMLFDWRGLPTALSLFMFCYCGHSVFPSLYTSMKDKTQFPKVLMISFLLATINYALMAIIGYLMYGSKSDPQITLNLPTGKFASNIAICAALVSPLTKYALIITPIATAIESKLQQLQMTTTDDVSERLVSVAVRTALVISTTVVALTVPFFGYVTAFSGAFMGVTATVLLPCLCFLKIRWGRTSWVEKVVVVVVMCFGGVICVSGTYSAVKGIVTQLMNK